MPTDEKRTYFPVAASLGPLPFSSGVLVGNTYYVSGHIGLDPATRKPPTDAEQEARLLLDGFRATLGRANLAMDDLVYVQIFCSDVSLFEKFNAIYRGYFSGDFPARAFLGSGPLLFGAKFEIQGIAVKRAKKAAKKRRAKRTKR
ncbi:MAG TPA: RidA family protein [Candidatus Acidoferrales bacterium]|nr:RidA family protein [Candidatus Acidoferrales bacterium]